MPQTPAYLSNGGGSPTSDDTQGDDNSKPETWSLFLPSGIPEDDRSLCHKGIVEIEQVLCLAQLQDNLGDLRRFRRALRNLRLYFKKNTVGEGQKTQTKSRKVETGVNNRIKRTVRRYRVAYDALYELDRTGDWQNEYRKLRDEDNRGPLKEFEEARTGDGRYAPSWIWKSPSAATLPGEESTTEQQEIDKTVRHEWMTSRARADRWMEEEELLQEEMRRVVVYLEWKSRTWSEKIGIRAGSCTPDIQHGLDAYARKQASIYRGIAMSFVGQWLPYLNAYGLDTRWTTELPWISQILSHETKLPKRFSVIPADVLHEVPTTDASAGTEGMKQQYLNAHETRNEGDAPEDRCDEHSDGNDGDFGEGGHSSDGESQHFDDESEGFSDRAEEEEGFDDGAETSDELGFEYDDDYMT